MKIRINFIDSKGFIHFEIGKSKELVKKWINTLRKGTNIHWVNENEVFISQQYLKP